MSKHVKIGVFIPCGSQTLDIATVDVLGVISKEYLGGLPNNLMPAHVVAMAPSVTISYITAPSTGDLVPLTSGMVIKATHFHTDAEVAPGKLDIIVVPGPDPQLGFDEASLQWLRAHFETEGVDVLCVCTGLYLCAAAGIADGKLASGPRGLQDDLLKKFPKLRLVGDNQRWVQDGNFWSSGGVTNGNDLMAAYARSGKHWPKSLVEVGLKLTDVGERGQFYNESKQMFIVGMVWSLVKTWFGSFGMQKSKSS